MEKRISYVGNKNRDGLIEKIINIIPVHQNYYEICAGSGGVFRAKKKAPGDNILIESNPSVIEKFKSIVGDYYLLADGMQFVLNNDISENLFYCDPPYPMDSRKSQIPLYGAHEWTDEQHKQFLKICISSKSMIIISTYPNHIYDEMLTGWSWIDCKVGTRAGVAIERLYFNFPLPDKLNQYDKVGENRTHRQQIKRKMQRRLNAFNRLPEVEKNMFKELFFLQYSPK